LKLFKLLLFHFQDHWQLILWYPILKAIVMAPLLWGLRKEYLTMYFLPVGLLPLHTRWIAIALRILMLQNFISFNQHFLKFLLFLLVFLIIFVIVINILFILRFVFLIILFILPCLFQYLKMLKHHLLLFIRPFLINSVLLVNFWFLLILIRMDWFIEVCFIIFIQQHLVNLISVQQDLC